MSEEGKSKSKSQAQEQNQAQDQGQDEGRSEVTATHEDLFDGAAKEARAIQKGHNRAQGEDFNEEYFVEDSERAQEMGYYGYSPTGRGELDTPENRSEHS